MARYQLSATVPAGTAEANAATDTVQVDERVLQDGFIYAAPGTAFAVRAVLLAGDRQVLPEPESDPVVIPGLADPTRIQTRLPGSPNEIELRVWAPNSQFEHTVKARVDTVPLERANPLQRISNVLTGGGSARPGRQRQPEP